MQLYRTAFNNTEHKIRSRKESNAVSGCEKVFHIMKEKGMDLAVLIDPADIKYVSGFEVPFWPAWMGDVSNGLPMVTAIVDAKREQVQLVASDMYRNKIIRTGITNAFYFRYSHIWRTMMWMITIRVIWNMHWEKQQTAETDW